MNPYLQPGAQLPDVVLPDQDGSTRRLSDLAAGDPVVLHLYRGWFCPKDRAYFAELLQLQERAEVAYTRMVSVSVEPPEVSAAFRAGLGARWTFLCDTERLVQARLGLLETTDTVHRPFVPTVLVLRPDLTVHAGYDGYWFWGRPGAAELWSDLRSVTRDVRPDWEVPAP